MEHIPALVAGRVARSAAPEPWPETEERFMSDSNPTVFVVDDDISVRESLSLLIEVSGWQPETFASAQAFLARGPVDSPSCLVLDVLLPGLSGLALQQRLAHDRMDMPIIF